MDTPLDGDEVSYSRGMLFTDGLPSNDPNVGYRGTSAATACGITYRQLDYWARTGLVEPSIRTASVAKSPVPAQQVAVPSAASSCRGRIT